MSLGNLVAFNRLQRHTASKAAILKFLGVLVRNLPDARVPSITTANRLDATKCPSMINLNCSVCTFSCLRGLY